MSEAGCLLGCMLHPVLRVWRADLARHRGGPRVRAALRGRGSRRRRQQRPQLLYADPVNLRYVGLVLVPLDGRPFLRVAQHLHLDLPNLLDADPVDLLLLASVELFPAPLAAGRRRHRAGRADLRAIARFNATPSRGCSRRDTPQIPRETVRRTAAAQFPSQTRVSGTLGVAPWPTCSQFRQRRVSW